MAEEDPIKAEEAMEEELILPPKKSYWEPDGIFGGLSKNYHNDIDLKTLYLRAFWKEQMKEVDETTLPRVQLLPPKRIRRIVKCDEDVTQSTQRIATEVVELFGKAAEMFISELTLAAWMNVPSSKKVIQIKDLSVAITTFHSYDFLIGVAPPPNACIKQPRKRATTTATDPEPAPPADVITTPNPATLIHDTTLAAQQEPEQLEALEEQPSTASPVGTPLPPQFSFEPIVTHALPLTQQE